MPIQLLTTFIIPSCLSGVADKPIVYSAEVFNNERQSTKKYRILDDKNIVNRIGFIAQDISINEIEYNETNYRKLRTRRYSKS